MRRIFADTFYWLALLAPHDPWADVVRSADLSNASVITTEEVLSELLTAAAAQGEHSRTRACAAVRRALDDPNIEVVVQSHDSFLAGLALYERRPDKGYSLTDCISMNVMRRHRIRQVLTHDRHFEQEGFTRLFT
jgi:predicted nucleic acid-binding protein